MLNCRIALSAGATAVIVTLGAPSWAAPAEGYPDVGTKVIKLVTHSGPGAGGDLFWREIAKHLAPKLGISMVVENVTGASGAKAIAFTSSQAPDGTILYAATPSTVNVGLLTDTEYNYKSVQPLVNIFVDPQLMYVRGDSPHKTLADFVADAKANPGKLRVGAEGPESMTRQILERLARTAGIDFIRASTTAGGGEVLVGVLNKTTEAGMGEYQEIAGQITAGELRVLATFTDSRLPILPDVATAKELGIDIVAEKFRGVAVPPNTPAKTIAVWEQVFKLLLEDPGYKMYYETVGLLPHYLDSSAYSEFLDRFNETSRTYYQEMGIIK